MHARDTTPEAAAVQRRVIAAMTGPQRLLAASAMADEVRSITLAGLRSRHPDETEREIHRRWLVLLHGDALADTLMDRGE